MTGNQREQALAFQAAEAALRQGEISLVGLATLPPFDGSQTGYYTYVPNDWATWNWSQNSIPYKGNLSIGGSSGSTASYYIEQISSNAPVPGQSLDASAPSPGQLLYAITARGISPDGKSIVILQSTYKR